LKKAPHIRHMTVKPPVMSDEQVRNSLIKVSAKVVRKNIDKVETIRVLLEDNKDKDT
ncbi:hypothetical protein KI387_033579, partial [Taxus chinensis]